jgi:hypothetical protein
MTAWGNMYKDGVWGGSPGAEQVELSDGARVVDDREHLWGEVFG